MQMLTLCICIGIAQQLCWRRSDTEQHYFIFAFAWGKETPPFLASLSTLPQSNTTLHLYLHQRRCRCWVVCLSLYISTNVVADANIEHRYLCSFLPPLFLFHSRRCSYVLSTTVTRGPQRHHRLLSLKTWPRYWNYSFVYIFLLWSMKLMTLG